MKFQTSKKLMNIMQMLQSAAVVFLAPSFTGYKGDSSTEAVNTKCMRMTYINEGHCNMDIGHKFLCQIYQTRLEANTFRTFEFTNCISCIQ